MELDFSSPTPIYKQIVEQVIAGIRRGELAPGARLPTERELAARLQVARGTVKKAYKELADNNLVEVVQGSGTYVFRDRHVHEAEYRRQAVQLIDALLDRLESWEIPETEVAALFRLSLAKHAPSGRSVRAAVVDCNPESLLLFKRQLQEIPGLRTSAFSIDALLMEDDPARLLEGFDLVLTTVTHHAELSRHLAPHGIAPVAVAVAPSRETLVELAALGEGGEVGILCQSNKFSNLVLEQRELLTGAKRPLPVCFDSDPERALAFVRRFRAVVVSPDLPLLAHEEARRELDRYVDGGGRVVPFDYRIDRGSLIHVEYLVDGILRTKAPARA